MEGLTNHEITICLKGGAILGPFKATWSKEIVSDVRELTKEYDAFLQGQDQKRFKYHLHDQEKHPVPLADHQLRRDHGHLRPGGAFGIGGPRGPPSHFQPPR